MPTAKNKLNINKDELKEFIMDCFQSRGDTVQGFVRNSDYSQQAVSLVVNGYTGSARIRRDMARYLDYQDWMHLTNDFLTEEGKK